MAAPIRGVKLSSTDPAALARFYTFVLGWTTTWEDLMITPKGDPRHLGQYGVVDTGYPADAFVSFQPAGYSEYYGVPAHAGVTFTVMVSDLQAAVERAREAGGKVLAGPVYISPRAGHQAVVQDVDGNQVGLWMPGSDWPRDAWADRLEIGAGI